MTIFNQQGNYKWLAAMALLVYSLSAQATLTDDEMVAGVCIIANQGAYTAMNERQAGHQKNQAKAQLDVEFSKLSRSFKDQSFLQGVQSAWLRALEESYAVPVMSSSADKQAIVSQFVEEGINSCMQTLSKSK